MRRCWTGRTVRDVQCHIMHMAAGMVGVHRMMLMLTEIMIVNVNHGGPVCHETVGYGSTRKGQGDGRRHHAQQIEQRNGAGCSQSLGLGEAQINHP